MTAYGVGLAVCAAGLLGLTFRFDYWSNAVEFLAACLACSSHALGIPWAWGLAIGLVLGLGRETIPLLALCGTPFAIALGIGSACVHGYLRLFTRTAPGWEVANADLQYGWPQWRYNLHVLVHPPCVAVYAEVAVYALVAGFAIASMPLLSLVLIGVTLYFARVDEPRVLTMLVPFAAQTLWR